MRCPFCGNIETQVKDSRITDDSLSIKRRRYCAECDSRFTTFERAQLKELTVVKKNGDKKSFDQEKLKKSIEMAVRKRPVSELQVEKLVSHIVRQLENESDTQISSSKIGEIVMNTLEKLDKVSFVRFASVYKNFEQTEDFQKFIKQIVEE